MSFAPVQGKYTSLSLLGIQSVSNIPKSCLRAESGGECGGQVGQKVGLYTDSRKGNKVLI